MNEFLCISYIFINYVDLLKHLINIDLHLQDTDTLSKLNSQQDKNVSSQKKSWFLHEKMKSVAATETLKFFASSTQFKNNATFKFSEFKQNAVSFNLTCWSCKKMKHKINNLMCFNYTFRQETCNHNKKMKKEKVWCSSSNH